MRDILDTPLFELIESTPVLEDVDLINTSLSEAGGQNPVTGFFTDQNGNVHPITGQPMPQEVKNKLKLSTLGKVAVGATAAVLLGPGIVKGLGSVGRGLIKHEALFNPRIAKWLAKRELKTQTAKIIALKKLAKIEAAKKSTETIKSTIGGMAEELSKVKYKGK